jgi:hypothetical protein
MMKCDFGLLQAREGESDYTRKAIEVNSVERTKVKRDRSNSVQDDESRSSSASLVVGTFFPTKPFRDPARNVIIVQIE